jgi:tetratricopeptide (TPR) repeat protein
MKTLRLVSLLALSLCLFAGAFAQKTKPRLAETKPAKSSPAEDFFRAGLKCEAIDYDCQISNFTRAANLGYDSAQLWKGRGDAYAARKEFPKAAEDYKKAAAAYTVLINSDPNNAKNFLARAQIYAAFGDFQNALPNFNSAVDLEPKDVAMLESRGRFFLDTGNLEKALADFSKALTIQPDRSAALEGRAAVNLKKKNYDLAVADLTQALTRNTNLPNAYLNRALAYIELKQYDAAINDLTRVISMKTTDARVFERRARAHSLSGNSSKAAEDYRSAVSLAPKNIDLLLDLGDLSFEVKDMDTALDSYSKALELDPNSTRTVIGKGKINLEKKLFDQANSDFTKAIAFDPRSSEAYGFRGRTSIGQGCQLYGVNQADLSNVRFQLDRATEDLTKAIGLNPTDAFLYYYRALTQSTVAKAVADLDRAAQLMPKQPMFSAKRESINSQQPMAESGNCESGLPLIASAVASNSPVKKEKANVSGVPKQFLMRHGNTVFSPKGTLTITLAGLTFVEEKNPNVVKRDVPCSEMIEIRFPSFMVKKEFFGVKTKSDTYRFLAANKYEAEDAINTLIAYCGLPEKPK